MPTKVVASETDTLSYYVLSHSHQCEWIDRGQSHPHGPDLAPVLTMLLVPHISLLS